MFLVFQVITKDILVAQYDEYIRGEASARVEGLAGASVAMPGDLPSSFSNPAIVGSLKGFQVCGSTSVLDYPNHYERGSPGPQHRLNSLGFSFAVTRRWTAAIRFRGRFSMPHKIVEGDRWRDKTYSILSGYRVWDSLYVGLAVDAFQSTYGGVTKDNDFMFLFNAGLLKVIPLPSLSEYRHHLVVGSSWYNMNSNKIYDEVDWVDLPEVVRYGATYQSSIIASRVSSRLLTAELAVSAEMENTVNDEKGSILKFGGELTFLETISLRYGRRNRGDAVAFGVGLMAPLHKLTSAPIVVYVDYARSSMRRMYYDELGPLRFREQNSALSLGIRWVKR